MYLTYLLYAVLGALIMLIIHSEKFFNAKKDDLIFLTELTWSKRLFAKHWYYIKMSGKFLIITVIFVVFFTNIINLGGSEMLLRIFGLSEWAAEHVFKGTELKPVFDRAMAFLFGLGSEYIGLIIRRKFEKNVKKAGQ